MAQNAFDQLSKQYLEEFLSPLGTVQRQFEIPGEAKLILGRDRTQERAIREVLALPASHPRRNAILRLLTSWKVRMDLGELEDFREREAIMAFSQAFLEWEQQTEERIRQRVLQEVRQEVLQEVQQEIRQEERQEIALRLLSQGLPIEVIAEATELSIAEVEALQSQQH